MAKGFEVTAETLNIRSGPGTQFEMVGTVKQGELYAPPQGWVPIELDDGTVGWLSAKYVKDAEVEDEIISPAAGAIWMNYAKKYLGVKEIPGAQDNPQIVKWAQTCTLRANDDETPWCSEFVNGVMVEAGFKGTNSAAAASWLSWGLPLSEPKYGCIVVLSRTGGNHVGFYLEDDGDRVKLLGGNQGDKVSEAWFDIDLVRGFRWPKEA